MCLRPHTRLGPAAESDPCDGSLPLLGMGAPAHGGYRQLAPLIFIEALSGRTGLALPETDYPAVNTLDGCADRTSGE